MNTLKTLLIAATAAFVLTLPATAQQDLAPIGSKVMVTPGKAIVTPSKVPVRYQAPVNNPVPYPYYYYPYYYGSAGYYQGYSAGSDCETVVDCNGYPALRSYMSEDEARWRQRSRR